MSPAQKIGRLFFLYLAIAAVIIPNSDIFYGKIADRPKLLGHIPRRIGDWQGKDLDERKAKAFFLVGENTIFQPLVRTYIDRERDSKIVLNALEDLKGFQRGIHDPRYCYEARGWTVQSYKNCPVKVGDKTVMLKAITYTNNTNTSKRVEIYCYLGGDKVFTSDIALRLTHFQNRIKSMFQKSREHLLYLGISTEVKDKEGKNALEDLKFMMGHILENLMSRGVFQRSQTGKRGEHDHFDT